MSGQIPLQISCATNDELIKLAQKESYTDFYKSMIQDEINRRAKEAK